MPENLNIYQKLCEVKASIEGFQKDAKGYNYDYVEGSQILYKIRPKMEEHGLLMYPSVEEFQHCETKSNKGKLEHIVILNMKYNIVDSATKESIEISFAAFGQQQDVAQAYGTALTYAERYFILKLLNIPTDEDDPDAQQKKQKYSKADKNDIEVLKNNINEFAQIVGDTEQNVKQQLGVINYDKLSVYDCMQALQTINHWKEQTSGGNQI
ncbi:ERF family protein [Staphylococcus haemolyticus]|uniref:ERF family protein n=1 Tax=Staphylococcus haemolyticus TaxID=1283 RepID=UPI00051CC241|nr:ERF family protein [Staphylococcus haemolyticus]KGJ25356.1 single-stranded DNA-binding protein [Staphylococcus haemolyticus]KGJ29258.1 single-stranded DNA-binding protein [Staphylococcus haemolyticus]MCH4326194.1 ERF family protein [Staphylococcus haemolyticus]MCH4414281.1 ERF family protein [Staphylococcus haemolyticus]MCH4419091.1 ERF family protein [Staphylococcus haemolyticus]